jgi:hypothetical protein
VNLWALESSKAAPIRPISGVAQPNHLNQRPKIFWEVEEEETIRATIGEASSKGKGDNSVIGPYGPIL